MKCFLRCAAFFGIGTAALMGLMAAVTGFVVALQWLSTAIASAVGGGSNTAGVINLIGICMLPAAALTIIERKNICKEH